MLTHDFPVTQNIHLAFVWQFQLQFQKLLQMFHSQIRRAAYVPLLQLSKVHFEAVGFQVTELQTHLTVSEESFALFLLVCVDFFAFRDFVFVCRLLHDF